MMMNADFSKDSSKQVALLELKGDGNNVAGYDLTKVDGGVSTVRTLEQGQDSTIIYEFTKVGDGMCGDSNNNRFDSIDYVGVSDVDECKAKCGECPGQGQAAGLELRGFWFVRGFLCACYLEDGLILPSTSPVCRLFSVAQGTGTTGAICNIIPTTICAGECWKVVDSNLQCPTPAPTLQCPTPAPAPTNEPTSSPSMSPTQSPSTAPTAPPSMAPTASPSKAPSAPPTMAPTESPSTAPTTPPTMAPTESPSTAPTAPPSMAPTASPTAPPSMAPTAPPTASPTMAPTESLSMAPTPTATASPTPSPSTAPTNAHSKSGKVGKANGIVDLQVQEMKSGGSSVSISPHVGILVLIVASRNLYLLLLGL